MHNEQIYVINGRSKINELWIYESAAATKIEIG